MKTVVCTHTYITILSVQLKIELYLRSSTGGISKVTVIFFKISITIKKNGTMDCFVFGQMSHTVFFYQYCQ